MEENQQSENKIDILLTELTQSREELKKYVNDVDALRTKVGHMFPESTDFRNRYVLDDKIKTMSSFYGVLLNIRQEINKTIKEEIEIRRKNNPAGNGDSNVDIRDLADKVEDHIKQQAQLKK